MRFSQAFIDRPIFAAVLSILIVLIGAGSYFTLPVAQYPEIAPPTVVVRASYPGASAEVMAETVATPLEQEINGVEDMLYMSSQSTGDGRLSLTVTFRLGVDLDTAQVLVQNRVALAEPRLPEEVRRNGVTVRKNSPDLMMVVHLRSPDGSRDQLYISNYATLQLKDRLARIDGVGDVQLFGARDYSMRIWIDPDRAAARGLSAGEIVAALRAQNVQVASGVLNQPPVATPGSFQMNLETRGRLLTEKEFENVIVKSDGTGRVVRLADVARVELGAQDYNVSSLLNDDAAVAIALFQQPGSNALATAEAVKGLMAEMGAEFPDGIAYEIVYNPTEFIQQSVDAVIATLEEAVLLVVLVVILFLQSWRAAVIPIVAIPVSLIGTCAVLAALGYSLNNLSLFGMVLAIGIVVDDAIVVVENVERHLEDGMSPREATYKAMDEVGGALVAIALVLAAVFIPATFVGGIQGQFFRQFAVTIATATAISCFVSLTLSPALSALLLRSHAEREALAARRSRVLRIAAWPLDAFFRLFNRGFDALSRGYGWLVCRLVRLSLIMLVLYGGLIALTGWQFQRAPTGFIPDQDQGYLITVVQLPPGAVAVAHRGCRRRGLAPAARHRRGRQRGRLRRARRRDLHQRVERRGDLLGLRAVRAARAQGPERQRHPRRHLRRARRHPGGGRLHAEAAARARHRQLRRVQDDGRGPAGARPAGAGGSGGAGHRGGECRSGPRAGLHALQHANAQRLRRHRHGAGRDARRAARQHQCGARGLSRLGLCERFQFPRPDLPRHGAGRSGSAPERRRGRQVRRQEPRRRAGAAVFGRELLRPDGRLPGRALQPLPRRGGAGWHRARVLDGLWARADGGDRGRGPAGRLRRRVDRAVAAAEAGGQHRALGLRRRRGLRLPLCSPRNTRAGRCRWP